jgi:hypothetical protein
MPVPARDVAETPMGSSAAGREHPTRPVERVERGTTPAPESSEAKTDVPSARPTSVPESFDADWLDAALARSASAPSVPGDLAVPVRVPGASCEGLDVSMAFLLLHVDGRSSMAQIAAAAQLGVSEVTASFLELVRLGCIQLAGTAHPQIPPESGTYSRTLFAVDSLCAAASATGARRTR